MTLSDYIFSALMLGAAIAFAMSWIKDCEDEDRRLKRGWWKE